MLDLALTDFHVSLDEGTVSTVGAPTKQATAKLFDVEEVTAREFGDRRVKIVAEDNDGNEVQIALSPTQAEAVSSDIATLQAESAVFE